MFTLCYIANTRGRLKKRETIAFRADTGFCDELDRARGVLTRSAFVREIVESGLRLRQCALKPWIGKGSGGNPLGSGDAVSVDRSSL